MKRVYERLTCCWVGDEQIALCPLHAAAPALLEALKGFLKPVPPQDVNQDVIDEARAAIAQAKGETS